MSRCMMSRFLTQPYPCPTCGPHGNLITNIALLKVKILQTDVQIEIRHCPHVRKYVVYHGRSHAKTREVSYRKNSAIQSDLSSNPIHSHPPINLSVNQRQSLQIFVCRATARNLARCIGPPRPLVSPSSAQASKSDFFNFKTY